MKQEIDPKETSRATAFEMWMKSPMPMVTFVKTFDVTRIYKISQKTGYRFTNLMCWCICKAASKTKEFYMLPEDGKLFKYDRLAINVIIKDLKGGITPCDIPFIDNFKHFFYKYEERTQQAISTGKRVTEEGAAIIGTSTIVETELDSIVNQYTGIFNNPFLAWGRYKHHWLKTTLTISMQFHHAQMDGAHAARFLNNLQEALNNIPIKT